jgi:hypothetical protein
MSLKIYINNCGKQEGQKIGIKIINQKIEIKI